MGYNTPLLFLVLGETEDTVSITASQPSAENADGLATRRQAAQEKVAAFVGKQDTRPRTALSLKTAMDAEGRTTSIEAVPAARGPFLK